MSGAVGSGAAPPGANRDGAAILFVRNTVASMATFAFDMALLWALVELGGIDRYPAAALAFLVAVSLHYALCRIWVFRGTERGVAQGYFYFLVNAGVGLLTTMAVFAGLVELTGIHYLVARTLASVIAGILVFFLNAVFNFKAIRLGTREGRRPLPSLGRG